MITKRPAEKRGFADHGWLVARHSFSFSDYVDPEQMNWGVLRVINEDRIAPGTGFGRHGHRDMEIVTYLLGGSLEHRDSLGNGGIIQRGEIQRMSAGKGILHSESNPSSEEETHLLQIWIEPAACGGTPSYEQRQLHAVLAAQHGRLIAVATPDGADGSATIAQDARIDAGLLKTGETLEVDLAANRLAYVHVVHGALTLNGLPLTSGDGAKIAAETHLAFVATSDSEFLLFNLPPL